MSISMFNVKPMPPQCDEQLLNRARNAEPATIGHFRLRGFPNPGIRPLVSLKSRIVGTAVTLVMPGFDSTLLHHAVGLLRAGDILLIDRLGDTRYACLGGALALGLARSGVAGAIVDGPCADPEELEASGAYIWGTGISSITTRIPGYGGEMNVPVSIGGAVAQPGDLVIADSTGIVIIPVDEADEAISRAVEMQQFERSFFENMKKDDVFGELTGASALIRRSITNDA